MPLKNKYEKKEELVLDIIKDNPLPTGVSFSGVDGHNRVLFDVEIEIKSIDVSVLNEITGKLNFIDRYYQSNSHLIIKD